MQYMDEYYVSKDDWDTMVELGIGECGQDGVLKKIPGSTKAAFTKRFVAAYFLHSFTDLLCCFNVDITRPSIQFPSTRPPTSEPR